MKKRIISLGLVMGICLSIVFVQGTYAVESLSNFYPQLVYESQFIDVPESAWYYDSVCGVFEYGIMGGKSSDSFDPNGSLTIAETLKLAAILHKGYYNGDTTFVEGIPWYETYVDYALKNEIIPEAYNNYSVAATRSDFALIITSALPDEAITPINRVVNGAIPDVLEHYSYGWAVYILYRAGVLTGSDGDGTFYPNSTLRRAEAATIVMRIIKADMRQRITLNNPLSAEEIYQLASPAVFYIEILDDEDEVIKTGSGFFISDSGLAVTNYHVIIGSQIAKITMDDGEVYDVSGIYDYEWKNDLALIQVDVSDVPYLHVGDSSNLLTGATVYALGSPLGLKGSFSAGIVSQSVREIEGVEYIQLDAAISSGSSGGALLDTAGRVVGITSATAIGAQNINLAMPINLINSMSNDTYVPLGSIIMETAFYDGHEPAPDFGAFFGIRVFNIDDTRRNNITYSYRLSDLEDLGDVDDIIDTYIHLMEQYLFVHTSYLTRDDDEYRVFANLTNDVTIALGKNIVRNRECLTIILS
ncbi:MAG: trypsin-like peptidase domain-containing protein [Oscillospiraceae bacterium]|nr:trypsin-like peptidase domain-containing protein [Oscillospiraceae bacterium]